jgi:hypothetical protein
VESISQCGTLSLRADRASNPWPAAVHSRVKDFIGNCQINRAGAWVVEEFTVAGESVLLQVSVHFYFDLFQDCYYQVQGSVEQHCAFTADSAHCIFSIRALSAGKSSAPIEGTYNALGDRLKLTGTREGQPVHMLLGRANWGKTL